MIMGHQKKEKTLSYLSAMAVIDSRKCASAEAFNEGHWSNAQAFQS